ILGTGKGVLRVFSSDFPLLGAPPIPVLCSIILTSDFPLLEAEVALIYRAWVSSKAWAWAWLEWACASIIVSQALVAGSGLAQAWLRLRPGLERENEEISRDVELIARNVLRGLSLQ
ncbi:hypothetical protein L208DRAFT_1496322, partial [Tricholoma matsutake]